MYIFFVNIYIYIYEYIQVRTNAILRNENYKVKYIFPNTKCKVTFNFSQNVKCNAAFAFSAILEQNVELPNVFFGVLTWLKR